MKRARQTSVTSNHRATLQKWLMDIAEEHRGSHSLVQTAISLVDYVMAYGEDTIYLTDYQLLGSVCATLVSSVCCVSVIPQTFFTVLDGTEFDSMTVKVLNTITQRFRPGQNNVVRRYFDGGNHDVSLITTEHGDFVAKMFDSWDAHHELIVHWLLDQKLPWSMNICRLDSARIQRTKTELFFPNLTYQFSDIVRPGLVISFVVASFLTLTGTLLQLHLAGFTHRDIKPGNVCFDKDSQIHFIDFGSASYGDTVRKHTSDITTQQYCPPECIDPDEQLVDYTKVDVWSMGCLLYSMVYGDHAFGSRDTDNDICDGRWSHPEVVPRVEDRPGQLAGLQNVITRCLVVDPDLRPDMRAISSLLIDIL